MSSAPNPALELTDHCRRLLAISRINHLWSSSQFKYPVKGDMVGNTILTAEESDVLRAVAGRLSIRKRTGEVGILHGMERFVSTQLCLKKKERQALDSALEKLGLRGGIKETEK